MQIEFFVLFTLRFPTALKKSLAEKEKEKVKNEKITDKILPIKAQGML